MDLSKLSTGDKVIGVSGIALLIFSFFKWLGYSFKTSALAGFSASANAWHFTLCWLAVILGVVMVGLVAAKLQGVKLPELGSVTWDQVMLGTAAVTFLFILIKVITGPGTSIPGVSESRKIGIFLGLISSIGLVAGAYLNAAAAGQLPGFLGGKKSGTA
jgi:hypothetical protein